MRLPEFLFRTVNASDNCQALEGIEPAIDPDREVQDKLAHQSKGMEWERATCEKLCKIRLADFASLRGVRMQMRHDYTGY